VLRATIRATEETDIELEVGKLRAEIHRSGLSSAVADLILHQVRVTLTELVQRGREIAAVGSQMTVDRQIAGEGYSVRIAFSAGKSKSSFIQRLLRLVWNR
jgi:hypothetical protein